MQVRHILQTKGRDIITIAPGASLADAAQMMTERGVGALVVTDGARLAGIISERDIVRAIAQKGAGALSASVKSGMTAAVRTCAESDTVEELMEQMTHGRFRHVPVVDAGSLCGMISIGDVVKTRIAETLDEANSLRAYISAVA